MNTPDQATARCPICNAENNLKKKLKANFLKQQLEIYYGEKILEELDICDYEILRCSNCSLEFASPMLAGSESFYQWVTNHSGYYPDYRWEWGCVLEKIKSHNSESINLLEVGCGSGKFLDAARQIYNLRAVGIDTTITSVEECRRRELEAYCESLDSFITNTNYEKFDLVVAFHCLEHVSEPKKLIESMLSVLKPSGSIFVSTPYSPMSFETLWFDPLNHPPHHITRWNVSSYNELARQLNLKINLIMPQSLNVIDRVLYTLNYAWHGPAQLVSRSNIKIAALRHPLIAISEFIRQSRREKVNNQVAADVVLVELSR